MKRCSGKKRCDRKRSKIRLGRSIPRSRAGGCAGVGRGQLFHVEQLVIADADRAFWSDVKGPSTRKAGFHISPNGSGAKSAFGS